MLGLKLNHISKRGPWYIGEEYSIDFVPLFIFSYINQVLPVIFPIFNFEKTFYIKDFLLSSSIDVVSTASYYVIRY